MDNEYLVYTNSGYNEYLGPSSAYTTISTSDMPGVRCGLWLCTDTGELYAYDNVNGWGSDPLTTLS